jgi:hypothetical protein
MRSVMTAGCVVGALTAGAAGQVVDIDARAHCSTSSGGGFVEVVLDAGVYELHPVGPPAGAFTAWNAWGSSVSGCDPSGGSCSTGWLYSYRVRIDPENYLLSVRFPGIWQTAELALEMASPRQLRVCASGTYQFLILDSVCTDNGGGVSLLIEPAQCPADLNLDGLLDFFDFLEFQDMFAAGSNQADFDCSGDLDFFDFLAFQNAFAAGC